MHLATVGEIMKNRLAGYLCVRNRCLFNCGVYLCLAVIITFSTQLGTVIGQISSSATNNSGDPEIKIVEPQEGDKVPGSIEVSGNISRDLPVGRHMWILVNPIFLPRQWWPQGGGEIEPDMLHNRWYGVAIIGGGQGDNGKKFNIAAGFPSSQVKNDPHNFRDEGTRLGRGKILGKEETWRRRKGSRCANPR